VNALAPRAATSKRLKYVIALRRSRVEGAQGDRPYIGLENIESSTGRLIGDPAATEPSAPSATGEAESLSNTFEPGDVLFGKLRPYLAKAWVAAFPGRCTTELLVMQPVETESRFLRYVCLSRDFIDAVDASTFGSKMPRADWDFIGNMAVPVPRIPQQRAIADYLDRETARLDALVAAKERVLGLLAEKRRALITRAVTHGLDPRAPLRDSGIHWLGEIPAHWEMVPFRWYSRIRSGDFLPSDDIAIEADAVRRIQVIGGNGLAGYTDRSNVEGTTVVIGRVGALCGNVHLVEGPAWITDNALLLESVRSFVPSYLAHVLRELDLNSLANKTAQPLITGSMVADLRGPLPPSDEQRGIVEYITHEAAKIAAVYAATERTIVLLKERRAALIAAAVTGRLEVS
jgi:type I restriction enzyme S subunit